MAALLLFAVAGRSFAQTDSLVGIYRMDCLPTGPIAPGFQQQCEALQAKGPESTLRFSVNTAGAWIVTPALSGTGGSQTLESAHLEGYDCLQAIMVMVCEVPRGTDIFKSSFGSAVQSRSGRIMLVANLGAIDLIKVTEQ